MSYNVHVSRFRKVTISTMQLTQQQLSYFETFGFLKIPGLFADDINLITNAFEENWANIVSRDSGKTHDHKQRSVFQPFVDQSEYLSCLIDDPRIDGIASSLFGDDYNFLAGSDGNYYVGDTGWHSDRCDEGFGPNRCQERKHPTVKMGFYLDPLTRDTGCLRVIPGSHKPGDRFAESVHKGVMDPAEELWGIDGSEVPAVALEVEPGDLLMFDMCLKHASFGGNTQRRMFAIGFEKRYEETDIDILRPKAGSYGEKMLSTANPARMRHLEQRISCSQDS